MKKMKLLLWVFFAFVQIGFAQSIKVSGTVKDTQGEVIPGVNVVVKGKNTGTATDFDGKFSLNVNKGDVLVFSAVGYKNVEKTVNNSTPMMVVMKESASQLDKVVVTALGISRKKKSLGYAVQEVKGGDVSKTNSTNIVDALSGKISGIQIQSTGNLGGSTRILLRGANSLTGNNQPLFIVDGVPIDNSNFGSFRQAYGAKDDVNGNIDYGNAAQDINPEDIESVSILKGPNAAALYGSRASNGVILITTKSAKKHSGLGLTISQTTAMTKAFDFPPLQNIYGGGQSQTFSNFDADGYPIQNVTTDESWGPKLDGQLVRQWDGLGQGGEVRPWVAHPDNYKNYFVTGITNRTNVAFSQGGKIGNYRVSYTRLGQTGITPNSQLKRNNISLKLNGKSNKFSVSAGLNYINSKGQGRPKTGGSSDNPTYNLVIWTQRQLDIDRLKNYEAPDGKQITWRTLGLTSRYVKANNPYWLAYKDYQDDERNRFIGNIKAQYDITDKLNVSLRYGLDTYSDRRRDRRAVGSRYTPYFISQIYDFNESNIDGILQYKNNKLTDDISLVTNFGFNLMSHSLEVNKGATSGGLVVPDIYSLSNSVDPAVLARGLYRKKMSSIYASASLGYKNYLFLDLTGRNDWSSTLPKDNRSYFYPSISGSFVFSEVLKNDILSFGKIRLGWSQVGSDTGAYRLYNTYNQGNPIGGNPAFYLSTTLNNEFLKPEITSSIETGLNLSFIKNRIGLDFTYYAGNTKNQIIPIRVSNTTGFNSKWVNAGKIKNSGIELSLKTKIFSKKDFGWNMNINWAQNKNEVVELAEGIDSYLMSTFYPGVTLESRVGMPYSSIYAIKIKRTDDGRKIVGTDGYYERGDDLEFIGSVLPDWTGGISNTFRYKNFSLSGLIDIQKGGVIFLRGYQTAIYAGTMKITAENGVRENPIIAEGVMQTGIDGNGNPIYAENTTPATSFKQYFRLMRKTPGDFTIFDASFIKLREISLNYNLPNKFAKKIKMRNVSLSLIGSNLAILYRNTPEGYNPESVGNASGNIQGREYGQLPSARSFAFNIKLSL